MNGKKAKSLRRVAQTKTVGMPAGGYMIYRQQLRVHPDTTKGVYRKLKGLAKL